MVPRVLTVVVPAAALTAVAWWSGGYFPQSWGALLLAVAIGIAAVAILADHVELGRSSAALVGALVLLVAWQVVTTAWAVAPDAPANHRNGTSAKTVLTDTGTVPLAIRCSSSMLTPRTWAGDSALATNTDA